MADATPRSWRVVFAGTPDFAVPTLDALVEAGIRPVAVYTQPDRPAGRGRRLQPSPVKQRAASLGIPVFQPERLKAVESTRELAELAPDLVVVVAYGHMLPEAILDLPTHGCLNVHASLLPRWRGAAPIQRALLAGDDETGISIMRMEAGLDTGPVYSVVRTPITNKDTAGTLHDRLAALGGRALVEVIKRLASGPVEPTPQPEHGVTWAAKLSKDEAWLNWSGEAAGLARQVRAFDPWPVAQTRLEGEVLRVWSARPEPGSGSPGQILTADETGILVGTGSGTLRITELQRPGGRRIRAADYARQRPLTGHRFE